MLVQIDRSRKVIEKIKKDIRNLTSSVKGMEKSLHTLESSLEEHEEFNPSKAIEVRISKDYSVVDLARELRERLGRKSGWGSISSMIYNYERGILSPNPFGKSKTVKVYLGWLKENGDYNPFNEK